MPERDDEPEMVVDIPRWVQWAVWSALGALALICLCI